MNYIFQIVLSTLLVSLAVAFMRQADIDCAKELNLNEKEISEVKMSYDKLMPLINPTGNLRCYEKCVFEKTEMLIDGQFNPEYLAAVDQYNDYQDPNYERMLIFKHKCLSIKAVDTCELANKFLRCSEQFNRDHPENYEPRHPRM